MNRKSGSMLIVVMILLLLILGFSGAFLAVVMAYFRSSSDALDREMALRAAESGLSYYLGQLNLEANYFTLNPPPHSPVSIGNGSFQLENVIESFNPDQWVIEIMGCSGGQIHLEKAILGRSAIRIPDGIVFAGERDSKEVAFQLGKKSTVGKFNPANPFNINITGSDANININGSLFLDFSSKIQANINLTGTVSGNGSFSVAGKVTENGSETLIESIDSITSFYSMNSRIKNDNANLALAVNEKWTPVSGPENFGDLIIKGGSYTIPSGTYRLRRFEVLDGAKVLFDTSQGPTCLIFAGSGSNGEEASMNLNLVSGGSSVEIDPKTSNHELLLVLEEGVELMIKNKSAFGAAAGHLNSPAFTRIIGPGGEDSRGSIKIAGNSRIYARFYAARHRLALQDSTWYGSGIVQTAALNSSVFILTEDKEEPDDVLVDPSSSKVLAQWQRKKIEPGAAFPTTLDELLLFLQKTASDIPGTPLADQLGEVVTSLNSALSDLLSLPPNLTSAAGSFDAAKSDVTALMKSGLLDIDLGQKLIALIEQIASSV